MSMGLLIAQTSIHCYLLRWVQWPVGEFDLGLGRRQLWPLEVVERVFRKENLADEGTREKGISGLEGVEDEARAEISRTGELFLANRDDRFDCGGE